MFVVTTSTAGQTPERLDLHNLRIGDVFAHTLSPDALFREMKKLGCPGIVPQLGKQDLLLSLARFLYPPAAGSEGEAKPGGITSSKTLGGLR
jgi:hypothetical protein